MLLLNSLRRKQGIWHLTETAWEFRQTTCNCQIDFGQEARVNTHNKYKVPWDL